MHSKSNLIIGITGYYRSRILTQRKGDTLIIKGPFTLSNSPTAVSGILEAKMFSSNYFLGGSGKMKPGL